MSDMEVKSRDKKLSESDQIASKIYILENRATELRRLDAQTNLAAIDLAMFLNASTLTFDESIAFVRNETSDIDVRRYAELYLKAKPVNLIRARQEFQKILDGKE